MNIYSDIVPKNYGLKLGDEGDDVRRLQYYLKRFGYIISEYSDSFNFSRDWSVPEPESNTIFDDKTRVALQLYQGFHGLTQSGELDNETFALLNTPRCGVPDIGLKYILEGSKWNVNPLNFTLDFTGYTEDIPTGDVRFAINQAFRLWGEKTGLGFVEVPVGSPVHISIRFAAGPHGDSQPFDGRSNILAHAFSPPPGGNPLSGQLHFDNDERWTITLNSSGHPEPPESFDLIQVAAHEIGHALGLAHSRVPNALMWPYYHIPVTKRTLDVDDIEGIRSIYGGHPTEVRERFRAVDHYYRIARPHAGAFPNFQEIRREDGLLRYGVVVVSSSAGTWEERLAAEL